MVVTLLLLEVGLLRGEVLLLLLDGLEVRWGRDVEKHVDWRGRD